MARIIGESQGLDAWLNKRHWLRKPQYQFIWDWNPRLINVGITGPVRLEWNASASIDQVAILAQPSEDLEQAEITIRAWIDWERSDRALTLHSRIVETGEESGQEITSGPGSQPCTARITLTHPRLWWPRGPGEPHLYTFEISVRDGDAVPDSTTRRIGVRRIEIDQSLHPASGRYFALRVNRRPVFCKGGNWVPPELIYSSTTREKLKALVGLAVDANFNLLRIWGEAHLPAIICSSFTTRPACLSGTTSFLPAPTIHRIPGAAPPASATLGSRAG